MQLLGLAPYLCRIEGNGCSKSGVKDTRWREHFVCYCESILCATVITDSWVCMWNIGGNMGHPVFPKQAALRPAKEAQCCVCEEPQHLSGLNVKSVFRSSCRIRGIGSSSRELPIPRCTSTTWLSRKPSTCSETTQTGLSGLPQLPCGLIPSGVLQKMG